MDEYELDWSTTCTRFSHGGVDWSGDDYLGRK
jgi:hypothetical protein